MYAKNLNRRSLIDMRSHETRSISCDEISWDEISICDLMRRDSMTLYVICDAHRDSKTIDISSHMRRDSMTLYVISWDEKSMRLLIFRLESHTPSRLESRLPGIEVPFWIRGLFCKKSPVKETIFCKRDHGRCHCLHSQQSSSAPTNDRVNADCGIVHGLFCRI